MNTRFGCRLAKLSAPPTSDLCYSDCGERHMADPTEALTIQFLTFVAEGERRYGETMDAWHTSCPRMTIWEDALIDGLVRLEATAGASRRQARVVLTAAGRARLAAAEAPAANIAAVALQADLRRRA